MMLVEQVVLVIHIVGIIQVGEVVVLHLIGEVGEVVVQLVDDELCTDIVNSQVDLK